MIMNHKRRKEIKPLMKKHFFAFITGMGSIWNLDGGYSNHKISDFEKDRKALAHDWRVIGEDLRGCMIHEFFEKENEVSDE